MKKLAVASALMSCLLGVSSEHRAIQPGEGIYHHDAQRIQTKWLIVNKVKTVPGLSAGTVSNALHYLMSEGQVPSVHPGITRSVNDPSSKRQLQDNIQRSVVLAGIVAFFVLGVVTYGGVRFARHVTRVKCPKCSKWWGSRVVNAAIVNLREYRRIIAPQYPYYDFYGNKLGGRGRKPVIAAMLIGDLEETRECSHCLHRWKAVRKDAYCTGV